MNAEEFITGNYKLRFNPLLDKSNRDIQQYTFNDVIEVAETYHQHKLASDSDLADVSDSHFTEFCCYLTGHDKDTISQMYKDWKRYS